MSDTPPPGLDRHLEVELRDGYNLRAWRSGRGEPLLLIHGFTGSVEAWGEDLLLDLALSFDVIAVDLLGHGMSDRPDRAERYSIHQTLRDVRQLLDAAGWKSAHVAGYSMGGRVSLAAAVTMPDRVSAVVLESTSPGLETVAERVDRSRADQQLATELERDGLEAFVDRWMAHPLFDSQRRLPDAVRIEARRRRLRGDARAWAACLRGLGTGTQPSYWNRLGGVGCGALVLTGGEDPKFESLGVRMTGRMPNATHRVVPGAGHQIHLEAAERWLVEVRSFLSGPEART